MATGTVCLSGVCGEREREQELVPGGDERQQARRDEAGRDERQHDAVEGLERRRAVDVRGLLEVSRQAPHEAREDPDGEGERRGPCS